jgi:hypothetical protein
MRLSIILVVSICTLPLVAVFTSIGRGATAPVAERYTVSLYQGGSEVKNGNDVAIKLIMLTLPRVGDLIAMDDANHVRRIDAVQYRNIEDGQVRVLVTEIADWSKLVK